jgi:hypothetical protein
MNVPKKLNALELELAEEGLSVKLLATPEGIVVVSPYADRCLARSILKRKGMICAPVNSEEPK